MCNNCKPFGSACANCDTSKGRTDKVRGRLVLVELKVCELSLELV